VSADDSRSRWHKSAERSQGAHRNDHQHILYFTIDCNNNKFRCLTVSDNYVWINRITRRVDLSGQCLCVFGVVGACATLSRCKQREAGSTQCRLAAAVVCCGGNERGRGRSRPPANVRTGGKTERAGYRSRRSTIDHRLLRDVETSTTSDLVTVFPSSAPRSVDKRRERLQNEHVNANL